MDSSDQRGHNPSDSFAQGESFRVSKNQSNIQTSGTIYRRSGFLHDKDPASLLVLSFFTFALAAFVAYLSMKVAPGLERVEHTTVNFRGVQSVQQDGSAFVSAGLRGIAFLLGIIGTLLPFWAVGRLIADAIRDGAKS